MKIRHTLILTTKRGTYMQPIHQIEQRLQRIFNPIVGEIRIKTYFSYYGIFAKGFMFSLYKDEFIFLRANADILNEIQNIEGAFILDDDNAGVHTKNFYAIPIAFIETSPVEASEKFTLWVNASLNELQQQKEKEEAKFRTQIRSMQNMNIKLERILKKINIHNVDDFIQRGYLATFVELVKQGSDGSDTLLYKLHGAIQQRSVYSLTPEEKLTLLREANQALYDAGLRYKFKLPQ